MLKRDEAGTSFYQTLMLAMLLLALTPAYALADAAMLKQAQKQLQANKHKSAIRTLTRAMNSGNLSDTEMAKALYYRGAAQNGAKKHGSAIADLTGALSLNKLSATDRKNALVERAKAFNATGYTKQGRRDLSQAGSGARKAKTGSGAASKVPAFQTVTRPVRPKSKPKPKAKPVRKAAKKPKIPAFRTSVAND